MLKQEKVNVRREYKRKSNKKMYIQEKIVPTLQFIFFTFNTAKKYDI